MKVRAIVLAAGKGTRMKSATTKVLHEICGRAMLWFVIDALREAGVDDIVVVTNDQVQERIADFGVRGVVQEEQLGTGHAVRVALDALSPEDGGRVLVAYGDMPLANAQIFRDVVRALEADGVALALVTARMPLPSNFGRIVRKGPAVERIVEVRDADAAELAIDEMNAGIYAFVEPDLRDAAARLRNENAQNEYYLTDTVADFVRAGRRVVPVVAPDHRPLLGINDRVELANARKAMNLRLCEKYMREGATIVDPDTTYLEPELRIGNDTVIYPNSVVGRLSELGERCVIGPNSRLSNAKLGDACVVRESVILDSTLGNGVQVGPFAHLRNEAVLDDDVRIGNFVEVKKSHLAAGVKANHLAYVGDAEIGERTNVGAGTITANYDGKNKNPTTIGKGVSIGSNSTLIAPVSIGDGALVGGGSVVTKDVPPAARVAGNPARSLQK